MRFVDCILLIRTWRCIWARGSLLCVWQGHHTIFSLVLFTAFAQGLCAGSICARTHTFKGGTSTVFADWLWTAFRTGALCAACEQLQAINVSLYSILSISFYLFPSLSVLYLSLSILSSLSLLSLSISFCPLSLSIYSILSIFCQSEPLTCLSTTFCPRVLCAMCYICIFNNMLKPLIRLSTAFCTGASCSASRVSNARSIRCWNLSFVCPLHFVQGLRAAPQG